MGLVSDFRFLASFNMSNDVTSVKAGENLRITWKSKEVAKKYQQTTIGNWGRVNHRKYFLR
jgi:exopolysaccharide biosynthesis protein